MTNFLLDKEIFCDQVIRNQETMFRTAKAILHQDEDAEDLSLIHISEPTRPY